MKADIKQRWIGALLSGEYEQGEGYLETDGKFCCLGVLCDLAVKDGVAVREVLITETDNQISYGLPGGEYGHMDSGLLPPVVAEWAGLAYKNGQPNISGWYETGDDYTSLSADNDSGVPFPGIAEIIREHF